MWCIVAGYLLSVWDTRNQCEFRLREDKISLIFFCIIPWEKKD